MELLVEFEPHVLNGTGVRMNVDVFERTEHMKSLIRSSATVEAAAVSDPDTPLVLLAADGPAKTDRRT